MLYLKASTGIEILDEFKGEQGKFIKTFAFNTKRNKNGWRVIWDSIKKRISDFLDKPGIKFVKCEGTICDLDHTEGATLNVSKHEGQAIMIVYENMDSGWLYNSSISYIAGPILSALAEKVFFKEYG